jgi:hypothetical protein
VRPPAEKGSSKKKTDDNFGYGEQVVNLTPDTDYSPEAAAVREMSRKLDYSDTSRELNKKINREYGREQRAVEMGINPAAAVPQFYSYQSKRDDLTSRELVRTRVGDIDNYPSVKRIISALKDSGETVTTEDVRNLIDFGVANSAADRIIAAYNVGDIPGANNVMLTLTEANPFIAAIIPDIMEEKAKAAAEDMGFLQSADSYLRAGASRTVSRAGFAIPDPIEERIIQTIEDPEIITKAAGAVGGLALKAIEPLVWLNEQMQHASRAANWNAQQNLDNPEFSWRHLAYGMLSPKAWQETQKGKLNEEYVAQLYEQTEVDDEGNTVPKYSPLEIEVALAITNRIAEGDPDPIVNTWMEDYAGNLEVAPLFQDLAYSRATGNMQELVRQIDSAHQGNTGQMFFLGGDPDAEYSEFRGSEARQDLANITGFTYSLVADPTIMASKIVKTYKGFRWALERLAPGSNAQDVLSKARIGKLEVTTPAYRFFSSFTNDLNRLDALEKRAAEAAGEAKVQLQSAAASQRQRMSRQYAAMPEDLIEDFRTTTFRDPDGKYTVEGMAAAIDDMNQAHLISVNRISNKLEDLGAQREALEESLQEAMIAPRAVVPKEVVTATREELRRNASDIARAKKELAETGQGSFYARVAATNQKRKALIPTMSVAGQLRREAVNRIAFSVMPKGKAIKLADRFAAEMGEPGLFAKAFSEYSDEFGGEARKYKFGLGSAVDNVSRMFSSIPRTSVININSSADATTVMRYARMFFPKRTADLIAENFRLSDEAGRRLILSGLVRSAAASRGLTITEKSADIFIKHLKPEARALMTGSKVGERYGVTVPAALRPSEKSAIIASGGKLPDDVLEGSQRSLSSDANGIEHALHLYQTADNVALPTIKDFEDLRNVARTSTTAGLDFATNWWSVLTLYGLRFSVRNAVEEVGMYILTGGKIAELYKGRKASQALRRVRPQITIKEVDGVAVPEYKSSLGMFASRANKISEWSKNKGAPEWFADLIYRGIDNDTLLAANMKLAAGDTQAFSKLFVQSLGTQRVFGFGPRKGAISKDSIKALEYLADSTHGMSLLDEISEAAKYLNKGGFPAYTNATGGLDDFGPGIELGTIPNYTLGEYGNIRPVVVDRLSSNDQSVFGISFWWRELQQTIDGDGPIGAAAVLNLDNPVVAKQEIARIIREDTEYRYKQKLSRLTDDADIDSFADDYFENVFQHLTDSDGVINLELRDRFIALDDEGNRVVSWWNDPDPITGTRTPRVSGSDLVEIPVNARPEYIFGQQVLSKIPFPSTIPHLTVPDKMYGWMGRQNARISREPIFLANYLDQYAETEAARNSFARALAKARGTDEVLDSDIALAEKIYSETAMNNAFDLTISYLDNPANRSNLAWKARNVSRYYRATEDFFRRAERMLRNDPVAYWKAALTYQLANDYGFTYTDDNGNDYFSYPANQYLTKALVSGLNVPGTDITLPSLSNLFGIDFSQYTDLNPFSLNGKVLGVTPSADITMAAPSIMGPVGAPLAAIFSAFPELAGLRTITLGKYSQPTGSTLGDILQTIIPAGVAKTWDALDSEQRDTQIAGSAVDAMSMMIAEGMLEEFTVNGKPLVDPETGKPINPALMTAEDFKITDQYAASQVIAATFMAARFAGSWMLAAYPQIGSGTASRFAMQHGIDSMNDFYKDLIEENADQPFPQSRALSMFLAMKSPSRSGDKYSSIDTMLPYTISSFKDNEKRPITSLASVQASDKLIEWVREDKTKYLAKNHASAYLFLAPRDGEFTFESWNYVKNFLKTKVLKSEDEQINELFGMVGKVNDNLIRNDYMNKIAEAQNPEEAKSLQQEMDGFIKGNKDANPWFKASRVQNPIYAEENINKALFAVDNMLTDVEKKYGSLTDDELALRNIVSIYKDYSQKVSGLQGSASEKSAAKKKIFAEMDVWVAEIIEASPIGKNFFDAVIRNDPKYNYGEE